ncbi:MAG: type II toxin-antitoxin system HicB family antitoxin [Candidatus Njordarchaeales archaeon]
MVDRLTILVERDEDGYYVASVAELPGCHTQARTMKELLKRICEAIIAYLEAEGKIQ